MEEMGERWGTQGYALSRDIDSEVGRMGLRHAGVWGRAYQVEKSRHEGLGWQSVQDGCIPETACNSQVPLCFLCPVCPPGGPKALNYLLRAGLGSGDKLSQGQRVSLL